MHLRFAARTEIPQLISQRLSFLEISEDAENYKSMRQNLHDFFVKAFSDDAIDVALMEQGEEVIGTGIVFYYDSLPSGFNPEGKNARITSMYVRPEYRRQGVGSQIVRSLIAKARSRGYRVVMLNASEMGRPMYEKLGFQDIPNGMVYHE